MSKAFKFWTTEEESLLRSLYPTGAPKNEILKAFHPRNFDAIAVHARGLGLHRTRYNPSLKDRLMKNAVPEPNSGCWLWVGNVSSTGYGHMLTGGKNKHGNYEEIGTHQASWIVHKGKIPMGLCVLHSCDIRICVNPDHLFLGTKADNNQDCYQKKRHAYGEKHGMVKLTGEEVIAIRHDARSNIELAKLYGLHKTCIWQIRTRKHWKHL